MTSWNFADTWEVVAQVRPDSPALIQGDRVSSWAETDRRADAVAAWFLGHGLAPQAKVAQYLYNSPEYLESFYAALKAGLVPVNTNYRYTADELVYLWDNADVEVVVYGSEFAERVASVRDRLPGVKAWLEVGEGPAAGGSGPDDSGQTAGSHPPSFAASYEDVASRPVDHRKSRSPAGRSGDDMIFIYTGGTTGMPKGVMWRQDDLWAILNRSATLRYPEDGSLEDLAVLLAQPTKRRPPRLLAGPPLMHGTALFSALSALSSGGTVVLGEGHQFSAERILDEIDRHQVTELVIVGDAFARPLLAALDAEPSRWDLSSLWLIVSSGVMWSAEVRAGLLAHRPGLILVDTLGSSEALGMARSRSSSKEAPSTAGFRVTEDTRVLAEDGTEIEAGSGLQGLLALRGRGPMGYYKDPEKSASTFRVIDGERWSIPGDYATIESDGTIRLLGRGSNCINTGGEKVYPEEVEEVLKRHPDIADAVVVGVPDDRFGEKVVAIIEPLVGREPSESELVDWAHSTLAGYKCPRRVIRVESMNRAANGKVDYKGLKAKALVELS